MPQRVLKGVCLFLLIAVLVALAVGLAIAFGKKETTTYGNFKEAAKLTVDDAIPVTLHRSDKTGLTIVHADIAQTLVEGVICLATEAHDNDGLPHTLEHLVFMGSYKYPYKGSLDLIANRCLASGTNAWTGMDQTCYTMTTAGSEGFLRLLPIFLDHIFNPTLNDSYFVTEIYHVNGKGQDGGVVFSEMKGRFLDPDNFIYFGIVNMIFPGRCGYKYQTGGSPSNLRNSTNNEKIKDYHRKFYRPENMVIIVSGSVEKEKLFESVRRVEEEEAAKEREPFEKPFSEPCPPFRGRSAEKTIEYPHEEEKFGKVVIAWRLDELRDDYYQYLAHLTMTDYLSQGVSSPLQKAFVETASPLSTSLYFHHDLGVTSLTFENVPVDRLNEIKPTYLSLMANVTVDLERIRVILQGELTSRASTLENSPSSLVTDFAISSFIYDETAEKFEKSSLGKPLLEKLLTEDEAFWNDVKRPFGTDEKAVTIVAKPSKRMMRELEDEDEAFIAGRIRELGEEGLEEKGRLLKEAKENNDANQIPDEVLASIPIPGADSILLPEVVTLRSRRLVPDADSQQPPSGAPEVTSSLIDVVESPYAIQISQFESPFVEMEAYLHSDAMDVELKRYLGLFGMMVFSTDVRRGNETIPHGEVEKEIEAETDGVSILSFKKMGVISVSVHVEEKKFETGLRLLREALTQQIFKRERLQHFVTSIKNSFPTRLKSSHLMIDEVMARMIFSNDSNQILHYPLVTYKIIDSVADDLENNRGRETLKKFEEIVEFLTNPKRVMLHIAGDVKSIAETMKKDRKDLESVLDEYLDVFRRDGEPAAESVCLSYRPMREFLLPAEPGTSRVKVLSIGTEEAANLRVVTTFSLERGHPDLAIMRVLESYFNMMEGPLWKQIRGLGLAYGFQFSYSAKDGIVVFSARRATDPIRVYQEVKKFVDSLAGVAVNELTLQSAKSTLIFSLIAMSEKSPAIAYQNMRNCFNDLPLNHTKDMMDRTSRVTATDIQRVTRRHVQPLFDATGAIRMVVAANPSKVEKIKEGFSQMGLAVETIDIDRIDFAVDEL